MTRIHSSRMRTARLLTYSGERVCPTGGSTQLGRVYPIGGGVGSALQEVCPTGGICIQGGLPTPQVCLQRGCIQGGLPNQGGQHLGVCPRGDCIMGVWPTPPRSAYRGVRQTPLSTTPVVRRNDTLVKILPCPKLSLRSVKI